MMESKARQHIANQPDPEEVSGEQYDGERPGLRQEKLIDGIMRDYEPVLRELSRR